ncbi:hypothetical protein C8N46_105335 [Kordia periserrulae]|uniref:Uncharacterized protein n=1 Tax=Kordia periserrulae TaxID=701523 RepID=A0A2T6BYP7_9FLAO|nr:hypothetical protein [Kordia periserrulae]PTX61178.1 hypothetical protein C8N46_105335 [Kordia periserrulae]
MIAKKYFSAFIILLVLFGFYQEQTPAPNQEIELQFAENAAVSSETVEVIQAIKEQLRSLGVEYIQVRAQGQTLKISYFSQENVAAIKEVLLAKGFLATDTIPVIPTEDNHENGTLQTYADVDTYKIDVYELQSAGDSFNGVHGKYILELHKEYDKSPTPNSFANTSVFFTGAIDTTTFELTYTISAYTTIPKENNTHEIPDVRAGPFSIVS